MILTIRTDKPEAEIGIYNDNEKVAYEKWHAHRELAEMLHKKINNLLEDNSLEWSDIKGIVCYQGPGSFTGLRIGLSVANALGYDLNAAMVGASGEDWLEVGISELLDGKSVPVVMPEYGADVHITTPKK